MNHSPSGKSLTRQSGAALITGLIFLVVLSMIGVTAARMSTLEERMSGNMRDRSIAMQAAEMALRDAERDISNTVAASARNISGITDFSADCGKATTGTAADDGLCYSGPGVATTILSGSAFTSAIATTAYGDYTGAPDIAGIPTSNQPRYAIEGMQKYCWKECDSSPSTGYRITVRAQGINSNTVVLLQEVFKR
jgi:type IV pilus assembly protein PilX